jgi:hypothetical protein
MHLVYDLCIKNQRCFSPRTVYAACSQPFYGWPGRITEGSFFGRLYLKKKF